MVITSKESNKHAKYKLYIANYNMILYSSGNNVFEYLPYSLSLSHPFQA